MSKIHQKSWSGGNSSELRAVKFLYSLAKKLTTFSTASKVLLGNSLCRPLFAGVSSALDKYHGFPISDANKQRRNQNTNLDKINMTLVLMKARMKSKLLLVLEHSRTRSA